MFWEAQIWTQHCRHVLSSAEQGGRITSLDLQALLLNAAYFAVDGLCVKGKDSLLAHD